MKRGFTIVELIMVIAIIGILMGIVSTVAVSSFKTARLHQAQALCRMVQTGISTYYVREGEWPFNQPNTGNAGSDSATSDTYTLTSSEVRSCIQKLVNKTKEGHPLIDVSGLWVSTVDVNVLPGAGYGDAVRGRFVRGMDFVTAVRGSKNSPKRHTTGELYYGYSNPDDGRFLPFKIVYSIPADSVAVGGWSSDLEP